MERSGLKLAALAAFWVVLAGGYAQMLRLNLPGHLSVDSVLALYEGRFGVRETWGPALYAWVLGVFDDLQRGTSLYVAASGLLLFGAWAALAGLRRRAGWLAAPVALAAVLTPNVLIYQGIVWKDVLFANCSVLGFVLLGLTARDWPNRRRWGLLAAAVLLFGAAGLLRQNGLVLVVPAALAIGWTARADGWRRSAALAAGWAGAVVLTTFVLSIVAQPQGISPPDKAGSKGVRIVQHFDLVAAATLDPQHPLPNIDTANPDADDYIRAAAPRVYSPERVDTLGQDERLGGVLWNLPDSAVRAEWLDLITERPGVYLAARLEAFRWTFATPIIDRCLPVHVGVSGPEKAMVALGLATRQSPEDIRLYNYVTWFLDTPAMSHVAYAALALVVLACLLIRRDPADWAMMAMLAGALLFSASFFVITIACDYRYLYFLDLAALTGLLYLALDPRLRRRRA